VFGSRAYATTLTGTLTNFAAPTRQHAASITLSYRRDDPYAVTAAIALAVKCETAEWTFARDLLRAGLHAIAGQHDVIIWPEDGGVLHVALTSTGGRAALRLDTVEVAGFLDRTDRIVQPGDEARHLKVDATIRELLRGVR
jgi:hypothetical protein